MKASELCRDCIHKDVCIFRRKYFMEDLEDGPVIKDVYCGQREVRIDA